jgi:hypothetical protein
MFLIGSGIPPTLFSPPAPAVFLLLVLFVMEATFMPTLVLVIFSPPALDVFLFSLVPMEAMFSLLLPLRSLAPWLVLRSPLSYNVGLVFWLAF